MALTTKTDLCNFALSRLGIDSLTDVDTDDTKASRACLRSLDEAIEYVAREAEWSSLYKWATVYLAPLDATTIFASRTADDPNTDYEYAYGLPSDFFKLVSVYPRTTMSNPGWEIRDGILYTDAYNESDQWEFVIGDVQATPTNTIQIDDTTRELKINQKVRIYEKNGSGNYLPDGITDNGSYFVISNDTSVITISTTEGGSALTLNGSGTGDYIGVVDRTSLDIQYISKTTDPTEMQPELRSVIAYRLAWLICFEMTGSLQLQDKMFQLYTTEVVRAKQLNALNKSSPEDFENTWDNDQYWGDGE